MMIHAGMFPLVILLLVSGVAQARSAGSERYDNGNYEEAARLFEQELADPQCLPECRARTRIYLASSLYALGRLEEARKVLEDLAREHPEQRVDPVRFPPELVEIAEVIRQRVESERQLAAREAELKKRREVVSFLRPEVLGLYEAVGRQGLLGAGVAIRRELLEGSVRVMLGSPLLFHLQAGVVPGRGMWRPFLGLRASLVPGLNGYGVGPVVGGRIALPAGLVGVVDLGADYFFAGQDDRFRFALTAQAGLGFDVRLP
jgi:hypothetical protein